MLTLNYKGFLQVVQGLQPGPSSYNITIEAFYAEPDMTAQLIVQDKIRQEIPIRAFLCQYWNDPNNDVMVISMTQ